MRVLLVEDDDVLRDIMLRSLNDAGHHVDMARSLDEARHWWLVQVYDSVLLDITLPVSNAEGSAYASALTVLREARARGDRTPVLILTARNRTEERIAGLDAGADDYLGKPYALTEVDARLRAIARRVHELDDYVKLGAVALNRKARRFYLNGKHWGLPAREFQLLWELITPPGRVVSKRSLSIKLSEADDLLDDNALEAFVYRLRKKLVGSGANIRTLRGLGYLLEEDRPSST